MRGIITNIVLLFLFRQFKDFINNGYEEVSYPYHVCKQETIKHYERGIFTSMHSFNIIEGSLHTKTSDQFSRTDGQFNRSGDIPFHQILYNADKKS